MEAEVVLKKIKKLEFVSFLLAVIAPFMAALIGSNSKLIVLLFIGFVGLSFQPYIYHLYRSINQTNVYKEKKFWPLVMALFFILFLILKNYYDWNLY